MKIKQIFIMEIKNGHRINKTKIEFPISPILLTEFLLEFRCSNNGHGFLSF
jgi:hypothetical protein